MVRTVHAVQCTCSATRQITKPSIQTNWKVRTNENNHTTVKVSSFSSVAWFCNTHQRNNTFYLENVAATTQARPLWLSRPPTGSTAKRRSVATCCPDLTANAATAATIFARSWWGLHGSNEPICLRWRCYKL